MIQTVIVGSGIIGRNHAAAIRRHPGLRVAALVDTAAEANAALAAEFPDDPPGCYATLEEALTDRPIDLVAVCTPTGSHVDLVEQALLAGRHVVVEKPLDVTLKRARHLSEVAQDAESRGLVASVISQHRFDPASVVVAETIAGGALGRLTSAVASVPWWRTQEYYDAAGWRGTWRFDGGAVMNQAVHTVDLLAWFMGTPVEVFAQSARLGHECIETEDVAVATLRFASGALAVLHATTAGFPGLEVRIQVQGTRGSAVIHADQLEYLATNGVAEDKSSSVVPAADRFGAHKPDDSFVVGHLRQYEDVARAIENGGRPAVRIDDGITVLATVLAMYASATLHRPVTLDEVLRGDHDDVDFGSSL
ncbi:MAG TPA: Gfo/Idh/MocA family oxidoreductase [Rugosimonospora sp.]